MDELRRHPWPGNVRELQSVLKQALVQANSPILASEFFPPTYLDGGTPGPHSRSLPTWSDSSITGYRRAPGISTPNGSR